MGLYVALAYYALPVALLALTGTFVVRMRRAPDERTRGRQLLFVGITIGVFGFWFVLCGSELYSEWRFENGGPSFVLRGPPGADARGYFVLTIVEAPRGEAKERPSPIELRLDAEGNARVALPRGALSDGNAHIRQAFVGDREVSVDACGASFGPEGAIFTFGVDGFLCSSIPDAPEPRAVGDAGIDAAPANAPRAPQAPAQPPFEAIVAREIAQGAKLSEPPDCVEHPCLVPREIFPCELRPIPDGFVPDVSSSNLLDEPRLASVGPRHGRTDTVVCWLREGEGPEESIEGWAFFLWDVPDAPALTYVQEVPRTPGFRCDGSSFEEDGATIVVTKSASGPREATRVERYRFAGTPEGRGRFVRVRR